jgi:hypothetical protein
VFHRGTFTDYLSGANCQVSGKKFGVSAEQKTRSRSEFTGVLSRRDRVTAV